MTQAPTPGPLWMMHVIGPDDIYPAPDHATAVEWCAALNASTPKNDVLCVAVPAIWIGTPEAHAEGLSEAVEGWTSPRQRPAPTAAVEASGSERDDEPTELEMQRAEVVTALLRYSFEGGAACDVADEIVGLLRPQPSGFLATLTDEQRTAALSHTGGDTHPQPSGETREAVRLALEDADALERVSEEADDNQWPDWAATMRQAASRIRRLALIRPALVTSGGQHSSATDFPPDDVLACVEGDEAFFAPFGAFRAKPPVAETAGGIGRNITFSPFDLETGNAVVSPQEPDGPYWTLIAQGGEAEQNRIAAEIVRRLNSPAPAQDDDKLRELQAEIEDLKSSVIAFCAPWAVQYAKDWGLPDGHLDATHYDLLERCGGRMDAFTRAALKSTAAQEGGEV